LREALKDGTISQDEEGILARLADRFDFTEQQLADMRMEAEKKVSGQASDI